MFRIHTLQIKPVRNQPYKQLLSRAPVVVKRVANGNVEFAKRDRMGENNGDVKWGVAEGDCQVAVDGILLTPVEQHALCWSRLHTHIHINK